MPLLLARLAAVKPDGAPGGVRRLSARGWRAP